MLENYDDMLTLDEVCEILHVGRNTAYVLLQSHKLGNFKCGRIWKIPKFGVIEYIKNGQ